MDFFPAILIISLIGGIVSVDTTAGWQIMISQPVVACPVIGLIFGYPEIGLIMGILLELPWLIDIPSGGAHGSEGNLGAVVATALAVYLKSRNISSDNIIIVSTVLYSLGISYLGGILVNITRKANARLHHAADEAAENADLAKISRLHFGGLLYSFSSGFILIAVFFIMGAVIFPLLLNYINPELDSAFALAKYSILGLGFGAVATLFINNETKWYFIFALLTSIIVLFINSFF